MRGGANRSGLWRDRRGVTALEYGLIACLIIVAAMGALTAFGANATAMWTTMADTILSALR